MNIVCSPAGIVHPLRPVQGIMDIVNAGFKNISLELDMCCSGYELEHFGKIPNEDEDAGERLFLPISMKITKFAFRRPGIRCPQEPRTSQNSPTHILP